MQYWLRSSVMILTQDRTALYILLATNATLAAIIELSYPLFTIFFSWLLFKENFLNLKVVIGGILMVFGAALIGFAT